MVPRDRLIGQNDFVQPPFGDVEELFRRYHRYSESLYAGQGRWRYQPEDTERGIVKQEFNPNATARYALAYLAAWRAAGEPQYRQRGKEALDRLIELQTTDAGFRDPGGGWYTAGIAGKALAEGYRILADPRYLEATRRQAEWTVAKPVSRNTNFNMFSVWHLAAAYELTKDRRLLENAIEKTEKGGLPGQLPYGGWEGHNSWVWYHSIILRGMIELYRVLPAEPQYADLRARLKPAITAGVNRVIAAQQWNGMIKPGRDGAVYKDEPGITGRQWRWSGARNELLLVPIDNGSISANTFELQMLVMADRHMGWDLRPTIYGILNYHLNKNTFHRLHQEMMALGECLAWMRERRQAGRF